MTASLFSILIVFNLFAQKSDSSTVIPITYKPTSAKEKLVKVTAQQMKANSEYQKGYNLVGNREFKKAIPPLKKAISIDSTGNCGTSNNGIAYSELGLAYTRLGDFTNAIIYLNKAIQLNNFLPEPYLSKSILLMQQGKNDLALETLNLLIVNVPDYAMGYVQRGFLYNSTQKYELALQDFNTFLEVVKKQNQQQNSKELVDNIKKKIKEIEQKTKK